jgi:hypothetical protein
MENLNNIENLKLQFKELANTLPVLYQFATITPMNEGTEKMKIVNMPFYNTKSFPINTHHKPISKIILPFKD